MHENDNGDSIPPAFWRSSANAVKAGDLLNPTTLQDAISGADQVHWRKATHSELELMRLCGVFKAAKLMSRNDYLRLCAVPMDLLRSTRRD